MIITTEAKPEARANLRECKRLPTLGTVFILSPVLSQTFGTHGSGVGIGKFFRFANCAFHSSRSSQQVHIPSESNLFPQFIQNTSGTSSGSKSTFSRHSWHTSPVGSVICSPHPLQKNF